MRKSIRPQSRRHVWIYDEDWSYIESHISSRISIYPGAWIREILHKIITQLREEKHLTNQAAQKLLTSIEEN